jgi:uncharacterized damage-inducible protein DinB
MAETTLLLAQLDQAYNRRSWHGTNLKGSIRGMDAAAASWRPSRDRHSIQEIVVHAAYWKYAVCRRLTGATRGSFSLKGSNWFARIAADERQWRADVALLDDMHRQVRAAVANLDSSSLQRQAIGGRTSIVELVSGIIAHDLYHAGQIQLLKKLRSSGPKRRPGRSGESRL